MVNGVLQRQTLDMDETGARILIVEDEPLIAMELEDLVQGLGFVPVGPAMDVSSALKLVTGSEVDACILDINIAGQTGLPVADELHRLGKPWIFTTGYDADVLDGCYPDVPVVNKPFAANELASLVQQMVQD
jgi:CheY-like chemotaxis protein